MAYCHSCGAKIGASIDFCSECGAQVTDGSSDGQVNNNSSTAESPAYSHPGADGIAWSHGLKVGAIALIPTIILEIAMPGAVGGLGLIIGIPVFTYLGYQRPTIKTAFGRLSFWTAIVLFMSPILLIIHTLIFAGGAEGSAEAAGAAIGGTILVIGAFVVGIPVGIGFYLLSRRYEIEDT
jgi:hypothetical protein